MSLGLCIVGCGHFAKIFAKSISPLLDNVRLYFASRDINKAKHYNLMFRGSGYFGSYQSAAENTNVQAMYICTPHSLHLEHAYIAASTGNHILIEKPISNTTISGQLIVDIAKRFGVTLMVAENYRFMPLVRLSQNLIQSGAIGAVITIQVHQQFNEKPVSWRTDESMSGGGVLIDSGIHKIHFLRYLLGEPTQLYSVALDPDPPISKIETGFVIVAKWASETTGMIYHTWTPSKFSSTHWISITGDLGRIYFQIGQPELRLETTENVRIIKPSGPPNGILPMTKQFITSIQEGLTPEVSGEEGLKDLQLVETAYESIRRNQVIDLS